MQYRKLEKLNLEVSLLGVGSMRFPLLDEKNDVIDEKQVEEMVEYAIKNGVNYFDHAWFYHNYKSEKLMGKILSKYDRSKIYIADKIPLWECNSEEDVEKLFKEQLKNLQTDYIDFYLVHAINKGRFAKMEEYKLIEKLEKWRDEGKIKYIGFSYHDDHETFEKAVNYYDWDFSLIQLNYVDINHQQGIAGYELLKEKGIPAFIMEPVKGGNLANFSDDINNIFTDYNKDDSIASWAIKWLANLDNVKIIVSGMSNIEQMKDNINTVSKFKKLKQEELDLIEKVRIEIESRMKINCTGCNYCMPCPTKVNIPKSFAVYNDYNMYKNDRFLQWAYGLLHRDKGHPKQCVDCGKCIPLCPQGLDIPALLKDVETIDPLNK